MIPAFFPQTARLSDRVPYNFSEFEPLLDSLEAARLLSIHPKTLKKMARRGEVRAAHIGKLWRFRASDLQEWLCSQYRAG
ncbi:helix-turn-helix domain-containing protein [Alloacidobacterium sp.]|uniref:helix-turn-helix domain-containing protein n=1 Tax=Alloacidobacterium sp. TaxID=2951999 RepID=UPI002D36019E|nr:helix-turn-helix domain-containing protein [Alloacidobacterium sp.]HYK36580.1 helix-turn-helix domain-containing protein [Alloacidobacterium sp.]